MFGKGKGQPDMASQQLVSAAVAAGHTNVYVTNLPENLDDVRFRGLFSTYGNIVSTKLIADKKYGFVKFNEVHEAQTAIDALNGYETGGAQLIVRFANNEPGQAQSHPSPGGQGAAPAGWSQHQYLSGQGASPAPQNWKRDWESTKGGFTNGGASWDAGLADDVPRQSDNLYVKGLPPGMSDQWLRTIFGEYGVVTSTKVLETNGRSATGQGESVALVRMANIEDASWLVDNLDGNIPQGLERPVMVRFADPPGKRHMKQSARELAFSKAAPSMPGQTYQAQASPAPPVPAALAQNFIPPGGDNSNLYVKDMPPQADDLYLYRVFAPFGAIQSVKAIMTPEMTCIGYGFVKFINDTDAQMALQAINGCPLSDGSVLRVAVKTEKRK